jgi:roadblock/LC7 domain-containing protein
VATTERTKDIHPGTDPLEGVPGVVVSVLVRADGRARQVVGLDPSMSTDTGHFVASVAMVLDTLTGIWSDVTGLEAAPVRTWAAQSGRYWIVGSGRRAWVLDSDGTDIGAVLRRIHTVEGG